MQKIDSNPILSLCACVVEVQDDGQVILSAAPNISINLIDVNEMPNIEG
ncbi:MAG: hypothetical protein R2764_25540 [Bacteroidales bacterium]